jgi:hypothetical protein
MFKQQRQLLRVCARARLEVHVRIMRPVDDVHRERLGLVLARAVAAEFGGVLAVGDLE